MVNMTPVKSDSIAAIGHDAATRTLKVQFNNGSTYHYAGVSADQHAALMLSDSKGAHLNAKIRPNFKSTKVSK